jgi:hypothetical protein
MFGPKSFFSMEVQLEYNISAAAAAMANDMTYFQTPEYATYVFLRC